MDASADTGTEASTDAAVDTGPDVVSCPVGFDSCGANPSACETDIRTVQNCGVCGNICESTNGTPACTSGQCGIQCTSGFGDCNAGPGCETFLTSDNDCGACGRTCQGLTCVGGACPLTVLLDQGSTIEHCEVAGTRIAYRVQGVDIRSIPLAGGSQTNLVQTLGSAGFTADGSTLFFADAPPTIRQAPLAGGVNTPFTSASVFPDFMVHDSSNVYWASAISIELSPKTAPSTLLFVAGTASNIRGLAAFGGTLYWTDDADGSTDGMVKRGPSTVLATDTEPRKIAGDSFAVYWTNQQPAPNGRVERFTLPSGPQTTLAAGDEPFDIAENAEFIYYTTESAVMRVRKDGSTPAIPIQIGSGFRWICGFDSAHIIYTTGGRIELLAK